MMPALSKNKEELKNIKQIQKRCYACTNVNCVTKPVIHSVLFYQADQERTFAFI